MSIRCTASVSLRLAGRKTPPFLSQTASGGKSCREFCALVGAAAFPAAVWKAEDGFLAGGISGDMWGERRSVEAEGFRRYRTERRVFSGRQEPAWGISGDLRGECRVSLRIGGLA